MNMEERLQAAVSQTEADSEKWHTIVHGDENTSVETENGPVSSVAKQKKEIREEILSVVEDGVTSCQTIKTQTQQIKSETSTLKNQTEALKTEVETLKNTTESYKNQSETFKDLAELAVSYTAGPNLFDFKWADHTLNDMAWLRSDTYTWQSGSVYSSAYQHLLNDIIGITPETETIGSVTITFYRATDGHKIVLAEQADNLATLFSETGIAWYYVLDRNNTRFKLPRTKFGFSGIREEIGKYIRAGVPDHTHYMNISTYGHPDGGGDQSSTGYRYLRLNGTIDGYNTGIASGSNSIYGGSNTVQPPATEMYLYFYVGNFRKEAIIQTAGISSEALNNKADRDLNNVIISNSMAVKLNSANIKTVVETYQSGTEWYRLWSDGWIEQGGSCVSGGSKTVTFLKSFLNTNYTALATSIGTNGEIYAQCIKKTSASQITIYNSGGSSSLSKSWYACGY